MQTQSPSADPVAAFIAAGLDADRAAAVASAVSDVRPVDIVAAMPFARGRLAQADSAEVAADILRDQVRRMHKLSSAAPSAPRSRVVRMADPEPPAVALPARTLQPVDVPPALPSQSQPNPTPAPMVDRAATGEPRPADAEVEAAGVAASKPTTGNAIDHLARRGLLPRFPSVAAWTVYRGLAAFAMKRDRCFPSIARIAAACGHMSERAVQSNLRKLIALGFVRILRSGGMAGEDRWANEYQLLLPPRDRCAPCTGGCTAFAKRVHAAHPNLERKLELNNSAGAGDSLCASTTENPNAASLSDHVAAIVAELPPDVPHRRKGIESMLRPLAGNPEALARIVDDWCADRRNEIVPMDSPLASLQKRIRDAVDVNPNGKRKQHRGHA